MSSFTYLITYTKDNYVELPLARGKYLIECWGAQGCSSSYGKGAYTRGILTLRNQKTFYLFVGRKGLSQSLGTFNGGGSGQSNGGGATDIRLKKGNWYDFESLKSRIMVAAGGGGQDGGDYPGAGGALKGFDSTTTKGRGGTQISGGFGEVNGSFGKGGGTGNLNTADTADGNGGGGGGYYGGGCSTQPTSHSGGGGSSFISGYPECDAISYFSSENNITHTGQPNHYSGFVFSQPKMIDGNSLMPSPNSSTDETGHSGNGYIRITIINFGRDYSNASCHKLSRSLSIFIYLLVVNS